MFIIDRWKIRIFKNKTRQTYRIEFENSVMDVCILADLKEFDILNKQFSRAWRKWVKENEFYDMVDSVLNVPIPSSLVVKFTKTTDMGK